MQVTACVGKKDECCVSLPLIIVHWTKNDVNSWYLIQAKPVIYGLQRFSSRLF